MTLSNIGEKELSKQYLARLWNQAIVTSNGIYWEWNGEWRYYFSSIEMTATALTAAVKLSPNDQRIPKVAGWLLSRRELNHWYSTRDTATILYALSDYLTRTKEMQPNYTASVFHNGRKVASVHFDKSSIFQPEKEIVIHPTDVRSGRNNIKIGISGPGVLYYTVELTQYVYREDMARTITGSGITVSREYRKLVPRWDETLKSTRLQPAQSTTTCFQSGDVVQVRLIVNSPSKYDHILVEDYLPAGCEAFDRGRVEPWEWTYWWVDRDVRDERVSFYVETLPAGKRTLEYEFRAAVPGTYHAMPPLAQAMYQPEITASGPEDRVRVR